MTSSEYIQKQLNIPTKSIDSTLQLLSEDCTIPFIARYRKDRTGNLDEVAIENIFKLNKQFDEITKRKESILKSIEERNALTPELKQKIEQSFDLRSWKISIYLIKNGRKPKPIQPEKKAWNHWQKSL